MVGGAHCTTYSMKCPYCTHAQIKVVDKRDSDDAIRRRRECLKCERRFTTYERIEQVDITVIKRNGAKQRFDKDKLKQGLIRACEKRISLEQMDNIVSKVDRELKRSKSVEIPSTKIGSLVMKHLKKIDKISYLRYASVYQGFEDVEEFREEFEKLIKKKK